MTERSEKLIILAKADSTNNYAMGMVHNGTIKSGEAVCSMEQTAGKGRRGKSWKSVKGEDIVMTIVHEMQWLPVFHQFHLSVAVALGCYDLVKKYLEENLKIKWPNDIYVNDRKTGGVLIENVIKGQLWQWAVIGIGLNINSEAMISEASNATSFKKVTGRCYDVLALSRELHQAILGRINQLRAGYFNQMLEEYNENLFHVNRKVRLKKGPVVFETTVKKVSSLGELITVDSMERSFVVDEIEWLIERDATPRY